MLSLKKVCRDELLQLALILSLLRANPDSYLGAEVDVAEFDSPNGTSWRALGTAAAAAARARRAHPKGLDSVLAAYERELFADLNSLGRYNRVGRPSDVTAYLLNVDRGPAGPADAAPPADEPQAERAAPEPPEPADLGLELSQEDMDLIEVLWKQDVDLGYAPEMPATPESPAEKLKGAEESEPSSSTSKVDDDDIEKLKALKAINDQESSKDEPVKEDGDPWAGLKYTIDTETGEYVIGGDLENSLSDSDCGPPCELPLGDLPLPEFLLDEALQLVGLDEDSISEGVDPKAVENINLSGADPADEDIGLSAAAALDSSAASTSKDLEADEDILSEMIQTSQFHHPHHRAFQGRMPFGRTISMEQRWQDLANLLSLPNGSDAASMTHPFSHHHALHNYGHPHPHGMGYGPEARGVLLHNATLTPPMGDLNGTVPYGNLGGTNIGNAVATSMNLTNSSEPMNEPSASAHYKLEPSHDMMYYQNATTELNQTDGFLSSILNDEDLQLMDMAMNEGMYTMRMLDGGTNAVANVPMAPGGAARPDAERADASSDSAVSSMGSERVPSLSDGEWCDAGSDSGHTAGDHYAADYHGGKFRPYEYAPGPAGAGPAGARLAAGGGGGGAGLAGPDAAARLAPVAQKKHQMFGKRCFQEPAPAPAPVKYEYREPAAGGAFGHAETAPKGPEMKYSCTVEFGRQGPARADLVQHNHTYHLPAEGAGALQRPVSRDKARRKADGEHLTRDEKRARALAVPIAVDDIINLPMDEFNERLSKYDLSESQLSLIRDIRRRGKNKVAAQNCRKRKLDQILSLADEVRAVRDRKIRLLGEYEYITAENKRVRDKYQQLYRHVFQNLRDPDGNQYSPYHYSLQTAADGSILVVPKTNSTLSNPDRKDPPPPAHKE